MLWGRKERSSFFLWNILFQIFLPAIGLGRQGPVYLHNRAYPTQNQGFHTRHPETPSPFTTPSVNTSLPLSLGNGYNLQPDQPDLGLYSITLPPGVYYLTPDIPSPKAVSSRVKFKNRRNYNLKKTFVCDGKGNILQDLAVLGIITGTVGSLLSIFTASYFSVVSNVISIINAVFSFGLGIPAAMITYLAATDRVSYSIANVLSVLSFANTFYGIWSIDFGNKDVVMSQAANIIGVFSLLLSLVTTFPELFEEMVYQLGKGSAVRKREVDRFINNYGCGDGPPTYFKYSQEFIKLISSL